jgi:prepilin-type N-terminal cleavage/methylation domain-containing protein
MKILKTDAYSLKANAFRRDANFVASEEATGGVLKTDDFAKSPRTEAGFTLAEIMVGTALLAVMVVSLYGGISFGFTNITLARQNLRATQIALEKMEIVRMYSWEQVNSNGFVPTTFTAPFFPSTTSTDTNGGVIYYGTTLITNVNRSTSYSNDMREVRVNLTWTNKNVPQTMQMSTFISQYGMQRYIY